LRVSSSRSLFRLAAGLFEALGFANPGDRLDLREERLRHKLPIGHPVPRPGS
jgi:hypothetical protein